MSKRNAIRNIITSLLLTGLSAWLTTNDVIFGWVASIFFGCITLLLIIRYFKTGYEQVEDEGVDNSKLKNKHKYVEIANTEDGIFTFSDHGFTVRIGKSIEPVDWKQVRSMLAYKIDRFASDDICLDVFCDNNISFSISQDTVGWLGFVDISCKALPAIDKFWEIEMATPGVETNLTVVYDRQNRTLKEIEKEYYNN